MLSTYINSQMYRECLDPTQPLCRPNDRNHEVVVANKHSLLQTVWLCFISIKVKWIYEATFSDILDFHLEFDLELQGKMTKNYHFGLK